MREVAFPDISLIFPDFYRFPWFNISPYHIQHTHNTRPFKQTFAYSSKVCSVSIMENENQQFHYGDNVFSCKFFYSKLGNRLIE